MDEPRELRVLSRSECLELLASARLGRVILSAHALPTAMPVNYVLDGDWVVFRSGVGLKLSAADAGTVVAFEVDHFDTELRMGWSVVVTGVAKRIVEPHEVARAEALAVPTWIHAEERALDFVRIEIGSVTGRRLVPVPAGATAGADGHGT
jgi:nitroimidazol reductase NimA-like FMN-containing flavoprotein (pyridoxamine 5'-phosphate oxidase superfamily)